MKKIFLAILTSFVMTLGLYSQIKQDDDLPLLIKTDFELSNYYWGCLNVKLSDTLLLDNDSILIEKSGLIKKKM